MGDYEQRYGWNQSLEGETGDQLHPSLRQRWRQREGCTCNRVWLSALAPKNGFPEPGAQCPCNKGWQKGVKRKDKDYSAIKRNELPIHSIIWMNFENITPREEGWQKRLHRAWFHFYEMSGIGKSIETVVLRLPGAGGDRRMDSDC